MEALVGKKSVFEERLEKLRNLAVEHSTADGETRSGVVVIGRYGFLLTRVRGGPPLYGCNVH